VNTNNTAACSAFANATAACAAGTCTFTACTSGWGDCDINLGNGCETNLNIDNGNCGACGTACLGAVANGTDSCSSGSCTLACNAGWGDCDSNKSTGCELSTLSDAANCGACGNSCESGNACLHSACAGGVCGAPFDTARCLAPNLPHTLVIKINKAGALGTATYYYTIDAGAPSTTAATTPNSGTSYLVTIPGTGPGSSGVTVTFGPGSYVLNATYTVNPAGGAIVVGNGGTNTVTYTSTVAACAFASSGCPGAADSDGDGIPDAWEDLKGFDYDCNNILDSNDVSIPYANKYVKDVYLRIAYMTQSPHNYSISDTTQNACPVSVHTEPATGHKPRQESIDFVVRAYAGAHLTPAPQNCGNPGGITTHDDENPDLDNDGFGDPDAACPFSTSCVDFTCLPNCVTDADCVATCNNECIAMGGAHCVDQDGGGSKVCRLWRLHVDPIPSKGVVHHDIVAMKTESNACANTTGGGSHTAADQSSIFDYKTNRNDGGGNFLAGLTDPNFDPKESAFKHFVLFGHDNTCYGTGSPGCNACPGGNALNKPVTSGVSELKGNDMIVSLAYHQFMDSGSTLTFEESGTLMHELGHNMGLDHAGALPLPNNPRKVNFLSVMNYIYQSTGLLMSGSDGSTLPAARRADYSHQALSLALDPSALNETVGIGAAGIPQPWSKDLIVYSHLETNSCPCPINPCSCTLNVDGVTWTCSDKASCSSLGSGSANQQIDWDCDGTYTTTTAANISGVAGGLEDPTNTDDWTSLFFAFQCENTFTNANEAASIAHPAFEQDIEEFRASGFSQTLPTILQLIPQHPCVDLASHGVLPVIVVGRAGWDATQVLLSTVRLSGASPNADGQTDLIVGDKTGDGILDLKAMFHQDQINVGGGSVYITLTGLMKDGSSFAAQASVQATMGPPIGQCNNLF
jgi:hypothetical protein